MNPLDKVIRPGLKVEISLADLNIFGLVKSINDFSFILFPAFYPSGKQFESRIEIPFGKVEYAREVPHLPGDAVPQIFPENREG